MSRFEILLPISTYYNYDYYGTKINGQSTLTLWGLGQKFSSGLYREEENQFNCSAAVWDGLELLSAEHLLFTCHPRQHLAMQVEVQL